jgi:gas vesicle protein
MMCLAAFLFAGSVSAQPYKPKLRTGPCKADIERFCKGAKKEKISACLKQHEDELSDACITAWGKTKEACKADIKRFCEDADEKIGACLKQHIADLSDACVKAWGKILGHPRLNRRTACSDDVARLCKDVEKGMVGACLKQHEDELSAGCKAFQAASGKPPANMGIQKPGQR